MNVATSRRILACILAAGPFSIAAQETEIDFYRDVYPSLKANCISCHNKTTTKGDLNMETPEMIRKGGNSGPGAIPGKGAESLVVLASLHKEDLEMPPKNNKTGAVDLTPKEIELLQKWIEQGAKDSVQQARQFAWQPLPPGVHPIYSTTVTADGRYAVCTRANQIFVYDLATRRFVTCLTDEALAKDGGGAHRAMVQGLAISPDGNRLASGSYREVKIWRREKIKSSGAAATVPAASTTTITTDGKGKVTITGADQKVIKELTIAGATAAALSPDGKTVAAACADGSVKVWDVATNKLVIELRGDVESNKKLSELELAAAKLGLDIAFYTKEVASMEAQNKALEELLKKANETIVNVKKALPEKQAAVKPTQEAKAAAQKEVDEAQAEIAKAPDGKPDAALKKKQTDALTKLEAATKAEASAVAAAKLAEHNISDAEAEVKNITEAKARNVAAIAASNEAIKKAKDAQTKATADQTALKQQIAKNSLKLLATTFSTDGELVAALFSDGGLRVWAVATGVATDLVPGTPPTKSATITVTADGSFGATIAESATVRLDTGYRWVLERVLGGATKADSPFVDRVNAVRFSPDGKMLAVAGGELSRSGDISIWDVSNGALLKNWLGKHNDAVLSLDFSPDGKLLASGGSDKLAYVTEVATGKQLRLFEGHTHHVMGITFRADGRMVATAGADNLVLVWDMASGERKKKIDGWTKEVTAIQYIGGTNQLLTSAGDNMIRIVSDEGPVVKAITKLPDFMQSAVTAPTGSVIVGGGEDSYLRLWDATNGKELAAFGAK